MTGFGMLNHGSTSAAPVIAAAAAARRDNGCATLELMAICGREGVMSKLISALALLGTMVSVPSSAAAQATRDTRTVVNDAWITTQIYARFFVDPDIKGRNITVETHAGTVTLTGTVQSVAERNQIGRASC